jgi:hypothetical protein
VVGGTGYTFPKKIKARFSGRQNILYSINRKTTLYPKIIQNRFLAENVRQILKTLFALIIFIGALANLLRPFRSYLEIEPWPMVFKVIGIVIGLLVTATVGWGVYRILKVRSQNRKFREKRFQRIAPLFQALESGRGINEDDVLPFTEGVATRQLTFELLTERQLMDLFPQEFYTIELAAESNLANWLEFPTELDALPDEIEHVERVTIDFDGNNVFYHVFKFRVNEPHWLAKDGWVLGVVGPYFDDSNPYDHPSATFSRFSSKFGETTPEDEARWVHQNISLRGS